jgi:hypothetical protein
MNTNTFKSIGAVLAAFVTVFALSIGTDFVMEAAGIFPSFKEQQEHGFHAWWMLSLALIYRSIYAVVGGYVTAALAPSRPMRHVMVLGVIGLVSATLGTIANWDKMTGSTAWYPILLILLTLPCVWLGGKLKTK